MAQLVTGAMGSLIRKLGELLKDEYKLQAGVRKKVKSLSRELETMHAALRKVADVRPEQLDELVKLWARDVRELSYDMEDILDTFLVRVDDGGREAMPKTHGLKQLMNELRNLFSKSGARHQIAGMVEEIRKSVEELAARRARYNLDSIPAKPAATSVDPRVLDMHKQLIGVDGPRDTLIEMLHDKDDASRKTAKVVCIVGCGGLGKTALARAVYNKLEAGFDCSAFVPVGQNPSVMKVLRDILIDLDEQTYRNPNLITILDERQLTERLQKFLQNKRYFIVIDDIWDKQPWKAIRCAFEDNSCGSKIVVTSRKSEVADYVGKVYKLQPLSRENSEKLLYTRLAVCEGECPQNQSTEVCDKFFRKSGGIPLAIITIASLLASKPREYWSEVYNSIGFGNVENDAAENTRMILSYSYYDLPYPLRTCLLYLSVFPEDHLIEKDPLVWKWIAEGFIEDEEGIGSFEVGERYFNELINRSMIEPVEDPGYSMLVYGCHVHDMVLDVVRSLAREQNFVTTLDNKQGTCPQSKDRVHRLAIENSKNLELNLHTDMGLQHVRSFSAFSCHGSMRIYPSFGVLRVLNMEDCCFTGRSNGVVHIGNLLHLRYLGLRGTSMDELPEEIGKLKLLQILDLRGAHIKERPTYSVGLLTQLLCLRIDFMTPVSDWIGNMTALQELQIECGDKSARFIKELGNLRDLRVLRASIVEGGNDASLGRVLLESLGNLHKIQYVNIQCIPVLKMKITGQLEATTSSPFGPHLRYLILWCMVFSRMPGWISPSFLPNLSVLYVNVEAVQEQDMKTLGRMPELRSLTLLKWCSGTPSVIIIGEDSYFKKLVRFSTNYNLEFRVPQRTHGSDCSSSVAPTILPSLEKIEFCVMKKAGIGFVQLRPLKTAMVHIVHPLAEAEEAEVALKSSCGELEPVQGSFDFSWLLFAGRIEKLILFFYREETTLEAAEEAEEAARRTVDLHPNHPAIEIYQR